MAVAAEKTKEGVAVAAEKTKEGVMFVEEEEEEEKKEEKFTSRGSKAKDSVGTVAERTTGAMGNIAAATGLVKKDEFPTDMNHQISTMAMQHHGQLRLHTAMMSRGEEMRE
ncbi:hypothetical protein CRUP_031541 [Coryphaenoides rupestris]|nr:hypothetical protein CRUP_031541 [Coryphaenoides rupestris]